MPVRIRVIQTMTTPLRLSLLMRVGTPTPLCRITQFLSKLPSPFGLARRPHSNATTEGINSSPHMRQPESKSSSVLGGRTAHEIHSENDSKEGSDSQDRNLPQHKPRLPRSVQATYLRPLKRHPKFGVPSCDLQLRSYSVRNVEFFADFALRAAYYLNLPASGPVPLPRIVERWTVPRSNFVHKKSQENFERVTLRRLIQIQDGHPETVRIWLAFLRKHAYYGVGLKANIWEHEHLGVGKGMDVQLENSKSVLEPAWAHFGRKKNVHVSEKVVELLNSEGMRGINDGPLMS